MQSRHSRIPGVSVGRASTRQLLWCRVWDVSVVTGRVLADEVPMHGNTMPYPPPYELQPVGTPVQEPAPPYEPAVGLSLEL